MHAKKSLYFHQKYHQKIEYSFQLQYVITKGQTHNRVTSFLFMQRDTEDTMISFTGPSWHQDSNVMTKERELLVKALSTIQSISRKFQLTQVCYASCHCEQKLGISCWRLQLCHQTHNFFGAFVCKNWDTVAKIRLRISFWGHLFVRIGILWQKLD